MGDERAETYLRLLAEVELRRAGAWSDPGVAPFAAAESALWRVVRAGRILAAAGALDRDFLDRFAGELFSAITVRSRIQLSWYRSRGVLQTMFAPENGRALPSGRVSWAIRVTPIGRTLRVASGGAPSALHFMSLVRTGGGAVITVVMRVHWPSDWPGTDLEITGAGPHHLPYAELWAVDERGTRYAVRFEGGIGGVGTAAWRGVARLSPVPRPGTRWLDLVGDGTRLIRLPLRPSPARSRQATPPTTEPVAILPGERLLVVEAERILASGDARGPVQGPDPGEIITVLTEAGAIASDSPVPGQLAAMCERLGAAGHGITVPAAEQIPAPWASVLAQRGAPVPADGPELFAPLAAVLPEVDGAQFALAGLSTAAGESHLHVVSSDMPQVTGRFDHDWTPGFSWWLRDGAGNWHMAATDEQLTAGDGTKIFQLRLTPPLAAVPGAAEVVVTGPATRVRATIPISLSPGHERP